MIDQSWDPKFIERLNVHYDEMKWLYAELYNNDQAAFDYFCKMMYEYYIDAMLKIANGEVMSIREVFPQIGNAIPKNDPRQCQLDRIWHQDLLYDGFDVALPTITFEPVNHKGSENDEDKNPLVNNGNPAYVIHYLEDPEPPEYLMTADC